MLPPIVASEMRAARFHGPGDLRVDRVQRPIPRPFEAVVAVRWCGICGSDSEELHAGPVVTRPPVTLGHEIVGVVEEPAADGTGPPAGTPVVVDVVTGCGACYWCRRHEEGLCPDLLVTGLQVDGGLAEYVLGRADRLVPVPPGLSMQEATLAEPLAVAVRALRKAGPLNGRGVLVTGGGAIGMLSAQVARALGAAPVVVVEPAGYRRRLISSWDIAALWDDDADERRAALVGAYPSRGIDVVVECSGHQGMPAEAARLARPGGVVVLLGVMPDPEQIDTLDLVLGEKEVKGSSAHMYDDDVEVAVAMLAAGTVDVSGMISHVVTLDEVTRSFAILADPEERAVKVLIQI